MLSEVVKAFNYTEVSSDPHNKLIEDLVNSYINHLNEFGETKLTEEDNRVKKIEELGGPIV